VASASPEPVIAYLVSGAGNDFLALVEPHREPAAQTVRAWCRRGLSVGADGLFVLRRVESLRRATPAEATPTEPAPTEPALTEPALTEPALTEPAPTEPAPTVNLTHFNADGSRADLCINGTRCAARLAFHLGWAEQRLVLLTGAGPILARPAGSTAACLELPAPAAPRAVAVHALGRPWNGWRVDAGVPHLVLPWADDDLTAAPLAELGPPLRRHADFAPAGVNVDLVVRRSPHRIDLRTWERGVEGETLACGSGVLAAVAAGRAAGELELPVAARTAGGWVLEVAAADDAGVPDDRPRWTLSGDARLLARLELWPEAAVTPPG